MIKLEFWTSDGKIRLLPVLIVPSGYAIPRIGEIVALPDNRNSDRWRRCEGIIHCFDLVEEIEMDGKDCKQFTVRVLLSEPS